MKGRLVGQSDGMKMQGEEDGIRVKYISFRRFVYGRRVPLAEIIQNNNNKVMHFNCGCIILEAAKKKKTEHCLSIETSYTKKPSTPSQSIATSFSRCVL